MNKSAKRFLVLATVLGTAWVGMGVGQALARKVVMSVGVRSALAAGTGQSSTSGASGASGSQADRYENLELFQKVLHFVENNYVEETKNKDLVHGAIKGMLETLDPHSNFLPPDVFKDMKIDTSGKFGGLGIEIGLKDGVLTIIAPIEDTPAWRAGLRSNDRIVKINSESTKGMTLTEAVSKMRGKKGTEVVLSIFRDGFERIKEVPITRDIINIVAVKHEELEPGYGYVRLSSFNERAAQDIKKAMEKIEAKNKMRGLVLDLRTNPGGLLDQAVEVSSLFLDEGVVVSTIGRNKDQKEVKYARKGAARKELPIAILVSPFTASAAEIVAGALQDHKRAIILGQPTFGKGSVQTVIELGSDMGLKLTIARYYTPSGRSIQEKGVMPDVLLDDYDPKLLSQAKRKQEVMREKDLKGHMANEDKEDKEYTKETLESLGKKKDDKKESADDDMGPTRLNPKEDYQVREAVNFLKSYDVFKKIAAIEAGRGAATAANQ